MTAALPPRTRAILIVGLLALAGTGAGVLLLGRSQAASEAAPPATSTPTTAPTPADTPAETPRTPPKKGEGTPTDTPSKPAVPAGERLPLAVEEALAANHVVVVGLYAPKAKIDATAMREANAGATLAGAAFVAVDVTGSQVDGLNKRYGVIRDPAVLVLRPPGDLIVRIDGFADRDTVTQAAANAAG
jgi:hypothetical protein